MAFTFKQRGRGRTTRHTPGTMNRTEQRYADVLRDRIAAKEILWCEFEGVKLKLAPATFWTPDFVLMLADGTIEFREVKGMRKAKAATDGKPKVTEAARIEDHSNVKIKVAASMFPFRFSVVYQNASGIWIEREIEAA